MYLCDYHIHTTMSPDATGTALDMVQAAASQGFREVALTDHFDIAEQPLEEYKDFVFDEAKMRADWQAAAQVVEATTRVLYGIELGQAVHIPSVAHGLLSRNAFDFVLLSLHNCWRKQDYYFMDFTKTEPGPIWEEYFDELYTLAAFDDYDVLAHLPYPWRYIKKTQGACDLTPYYDRIEAILKRVIETGHGIEINTSTLRQGLGSPMPGYDIAALYRKLGGEIITVGSDAHQPNQVGAFVPEAYEALQHLGFRYITTYRSRRPEFVKLG